jgi:hypothetical protein
MNTNRVPFLIGMIGEACPSFFSASYSESPSCFSLMCSVKAQVSCCDWTVVEVMTPVRRNHGHSIRLSGRLHQKRKAGQSWTGLPRLCTLAVWLWTLVNVPQRANAGQLQQQSDKVCRADSECGGRQYCKFPDKKATQGNCICMLAWGTVGPPACTTMTGVSCQTDWDIKF